ncbi:cytochrome C biogenesis protein [Aureibaculum marinum]|uniref:Cytochrome C biogenesis protein n=1 Tax=Aureibaculum marinum TaxID=2487930 RepID=A0A3N4P4U2_9FLAO|nr:cytochrome c biogenesis protein CcsA [Aureibaculum marinum]RPD98759.1 cytochrome C biogenesis protein [Aureibaculum marinum]
MKKFYNILFSTRLTAILFIVFGAANGIATFIENDYGTQASKALVYNTWWFELIMLIFVGNFIGNIFRYRLLRKEKFSVLIFHLAFIFIIIGAGITRYISYEAIMPIKEGETTNLMLSEKTTINVHVDDGKVAREINKRYFFAPEIGDEKRFIPLVSKFFNFLRGGNDFSFNADFKDKPVTVNYINYIPNAFEKFEEDPSGTDFLHFVESGGGGRHDHYIKKGEVANIHNALVSYENKTEGAINIFTENDTLKIQSPFAGDYMVMATQARGTIVKDSVQTFNLRALHNIGNLQFVVPEANLKGNLIETSGDKDEHPADKLTVEIVTENEKKIVDLYGYQFAATPPEMFSMDGLNFRISYGARQLKLPFFIKLNDFQLDRYPGSESPKSYASEVTVLDNGNNFDFRIYMNHILIHRGFKFFQSSYRITDEFEETHLSVNHDAVGTWVTYFGYSLLYFGLIMILFSKTSRFGALRKALNKVKEKKATLSLFLLFFGAVSFAQDNHSSHILTKEKIDSILTAQKASKEHAEKFGSLIIQDANGRMKPVNTFTSELIRKVSKKDTYNGLDANQIAISMVTNPRIWMSVPFIYIKPANTRVREIIGIPEDQKYARLSDFFTTRGEYKLSVEVEKAYKKKIKNKFEESILNIDGRVTLLYQAVINGSIFKFFPLQGDPNNKWFSYVEHKLAGFKGTDSLYVANVIPLYANGLKLAAEKNDYSKADEFLESMHRYQHKFGGAVMPSDRKVELELLYNKYDIFRSLFMYYMLAALFLFVVVIVQIFNNSKLIVRFVQAGVFIIIALFIFHTIGLGIRWYISGHAPWSNGYEAMIYVAWATMLFGLLFGKKSSLTVAATTFVVSMILMIAHWNWLDPSIGTLVPVLDSYWLMIHVAIIVGSYGPLTIGMVLGLLSLVLFAVTTTKNKHKLDLAIKEVTIINEMALTIGLVMLTIGNFLGGMWANESWGRYWGWDPKETWALVSIMVYAFVLHMRLVPGLRSRFAFNMISVFAYASILMTFLGVNHLLSGLHSYAVGDAVPIPNEIWGWLIVSAIISVLGYLKFKKYYKKTKKIK